MKCFVFVVLLSASTLIATGQNRAVQLRNGSNSVTLRAPNAGGHISFTLPSADGTAGQVLSTDGSGGFQWSNGGGGGGGASSINDLTDGVLGGTNFTNSVLLGHDYTAGQLVTATHNAGLGTTSLNALTTGDNNTAIGYNSLVALTTGSQNTVIGAGAGATLVGANGNTLIGYQAGANETGSNKLYISNSSDATPLIYGDFGSDALTINGSLTISTFSSAGIVKNNASGVLSSGQVSLTSDVTGTLPIANGGTGATTASGVRTALGLGTIATQDAGSVTITGGTINGASVGATTASTGAFTTLSASGTTSLASTLTISGSTVNAPTAGASKTAATTANGTSFDAFTSSYVKVAVTASASGAGYVKLPAGTDGQVVYLRIAFTAAAGNNSVTIVNSDGSNSNTAMVYDGTGSDVIVAQMMYSSTDSRWVIFSAILNP